MRHKHENNMEFWNISILTITIIIFITVCSLECEKKILNHFIDVNNMIRLLFSISIAHTFFFYVMADIRLQV